MPTRSMLHFITFVYRVIEVNASFSATGAAKLENICKVSVTLYCIIYPKMTLLNIYLNGGDSTKKFILFISSRSFSYIVIISVVVVM